MFTDTRLRVPVVQELQINGFRLVDARTLRDALTPGENERIRSAWTRLQLFLDDRRPEAKICELSLDVQKRYDSSLFSARKRNPELTIIEFEKTYVPVIDDTELDPRLGRLTLIAYDDREGIIGVFHLYNIKLQQETARRWEVSAYASPSIESSRGVMDDGDIGQMMKGLLEEDLIFRDDPSQVLDVIEWEFPTRRDRAWIEREGESHAARSLLWLAGHDGETRDTGEEVVPKRIRRKANGRG